MATLSKVYQRKQAERLLKPKQGSDQYAAFPSIEASGELKTGDVLLSKSGNYRLVVAAGKRVKFISLFKDGFVALQEAEYKQINPEQIVAIVRRKKGAPFESFFTELTELKPRCKVLLNIQSLLDCCVNQAEQRISFIFDNDSFITRSVQKQDTIHFRRLDIYTGQYGNLEDEFIQQVRFNLGFSKSTQKEVMFSVLLANHLMNAVRYFGD